MADEPLAIPLDEIQVDEKLNFIEEPVEIMDREVKRLKQNRIPIVKICWNSRRGPEFTRERKDQMQKKVPSSFPKFYTGGRYHVMSFEDKALLMGKEYIMDREVKRLKQSCIPIVKRWVVVEFGGVGGGVVVVSAGVGDGDGGFGGGGGFGGVMMVAAVV
nr:putative reverse transcriptase domain-containing protein [Tanacetum cinerariifolium]